MGEAVTDLTRVSGRLKPIWWRILAGTAIAAVIGWAVDLIAPSWNLVVFGVLFGALFGLLGLRPSKVALGLVVGLVVGAVFQQLWPEATLPWLAAAILPVYRTLVAFLYRGEQIEIMGERVALGDLEFVVPFAARHRYVGVDFLKEYADLTGAAFVRDAPDIGILQRFDDLAGPYSDPAAAHPLIREFYEHTSRAGSTAHAKNWGTCSTPRGQRAPPCQLSTLSHLRWRRCKLPPKGKRARSRRSWSERQPWAPSTRSPLPVCTPCRR